MDDATIFLFLLAFAAIVVVLVNALTPERSYDKHGPNPYFYVTKRGGFGVDIEKMIKEDPDLFREKYIKPAEDFRKYFEARGHVFHKDGRIEPPIRIQD